MIGLVEILKCGENPGIGHYQSVETGEIIYLNDNSDRLPPCPINRKSCDWRKVDWFLYFFHRGYKGIINF